MDKEGASSKVKAVVPVDSMCFASIPNFKRHRVSTVRDFPPGCEKVTASNFGLT
ncbi:hypothetical protein J1N35_011523, partial [Gossypium stocksii]